ncbi:hypothetical protein CAP40_17215 [Sphingomonas sp. IBVSS2]|uniref:aspartyl protease family protein n=1 Tax=Sphingomonas sp. IBVSS2 TaxID=1985172 RepID=UPI000A2DBD06|nr:aspartyl protease family protein [Sphingomonas sp. IBVSS2]OSZ64392.1 hypothetical protein CAP40_17215 [Sphingomonas sp. IBVSS2]
MLRALALPALALLLGAAPELPHFAIERPETLGGRPVGGRLPIVHAVIAGRPGTFLLDTGAGLTVIAPRFADATGLVPGAAIAGHDSGGRPVTGRTLEQVDITIGTVRRRFPRLAVMQIGMLDPLGIDGVISPQSFADPDCLRIDFALGIATLAPPADPACTLDGVAVPMGKGYRPYAPASASDGSQADFLVDSGAWRTSLPAEFAPDVPVLGAEAHSGVAGIAEAAELVGPLTLTLGGRPLHVQSARRTGAGRDALLGFDLLSRAVLLIRPGKDALLRLAP